MSHSPSDFVNSESVDTTQKTHDLLPRLELIRKPLVPESFPSAPTTSSLEEFDFSTPPWLLAPRDGFLDIDGVIPLESLEQLGAHWINDRRNARRRSEKTLASYQDALKSLSWFLRARNCQECSERELFQFFEYCQIGHTFPGGRWGKPHLTKPLSSRTIAIYHANLRAFFNWSLKNRFLSVSPLERIDTPAFRSPTIQPFTREQMDALFAAAKKSDLPHRNVAILAFLYDTGLRQQELCDLDLLDIDWEQCSAQVRHGKGDKARVVIFSPEAAAQLWEYLRQDQRARPGKVFRSQRGGGLTGNGLYQLFERLGKAARLTGVRCSPHTMRHTYASHAIENGASEDEVRRQLGHTTNHMTKRYVELADEFKRERHQSYSPLARLLDNSTTIRRRGRPRKR